MWNWTSRTHTTPLWGRNAPAGAFRKNRNARNTKAFENKRTPEDRKAPRPGKKGPRRRKTPRTPCGAKLCPRSDCAGNFARTQAAGADVDITGGTVHHGLHSFHIGFPCPVCTSMRVGDLDAKADALPAAITFRHFPAPPLSVSKSREAAFNAVKTPLLFKSL